MRAGEMTKPSAKTLWIMFTQSHIIVSEEIVRVLNGSRSVDMWHNKESGEFAIVEGDEFSMSISYGTQGQIKTKFSSIMVAEGFPTGRRIKAEQIRFNDRIGFIVKS